jgi:sigma-B regulation protein RsbU (phosphoserine phosphatase)
VKKVIDCELFAILLYTEKYQELRIRYAVGHRPEIVNKLTLTLNDGITGAAAKLREPILVGDVRNDPRYLSSIDAVRTELAVPMIARQKLVGVIDVQSTRLNAYTEYDRALLRLIANRIAVAIENARLYRRVERNHRTLRTLSAVSNEISSILDLDELLAKISTSVRGLIHFDAFSILLIDEEQKALRHRFSIRYDTLGRLPRIRFPVLIAHSRDDDLIRFGHAEKNFAAANEPKSFLEIAGNHVNVLETGREAYLAGLDRFLAVHFNRATAPQDSAHH